EVLYIVYRAYGIEKRCDVRLDNRSRIDDGHLPAADDIGDGPLEREWPGIVGEQAPHAGRHLLHRFWRKIESFIEGNVGAHVNRVSSPQITIASQVVR